MPIYQTDTNVCQLTTHFPVWLSLHQGFHREQFSVLYCSSLLWMQNLPNPFIYPFMPTTLNAARKSFPHNADCPLFQSEINLICNWSITSQLPLLDSKTCFIWFCQNPANRCAWSYSISIEAKNSYKDHSLKVLLLLKVNLEYFFECLWKQLMFYHIGRLKENSSVVMEMEHLVYCYSTEHIHHQYTISKLLVCFE